MSRYICIYCRKEGSSSFFNREHVLQQAFGTFMNNLILKNKVCKNCNQYFGDTIDYDLGRNSLEAMLRYSHGIKPAYEFEPSKGFSLTFRLAESEWKGLVMQIKYSKKKDELVVIPKSGQIGFRKENNLWDFLTFDEVLSKKGDLKKIYSLSNGGILIPPKTKWLDAQKILANAGVRLERHDEQYITLPRTMLVAIEANANKAINRCMAKIAFNYLAHFNETSEMLASSFDEIRNFIRFDSDADAVIHISKESLLYDEDRIKRRLVHLITVNYAADKTAIVAQVSLFNYLKYSICLAKNCSGQNVKVRFGHCFDFVSKKIEPLERSSLIIPRQKILIPESKIITPW